LAQTELAQTEFDQAESARSAMDWRRLVESRLVAAGLSYGQGTDNAADEAAWLVLAAMDAPLDGSFADWDRRVGPTAGQRIADLLARRVEERMPVAYLTGLARFAGLEFEVSRDVLIPRSPLAELVEERFTPWVPDHRLQRMLDLCTGSGCIAVASAVHVPGLRVDAADISASALQIAAGNVARHGVGERVSLLESDLFDQVVDGPYDLIVSNPPYVPRAEVASLPPEFRAEPGLGLAAGEDGLDLVLRILLDSTRFLAPHGSLICEVGHSADRLEAVLPRVPFVWIEFTRGGSGVFTLGWRQLSEARREVARLLATREEG
jgi:ribosomal protein L3 glutamine methyltransferase